MHLPFSIRSIDNDDKRHVAKTAVSNQKAMILKILQSMECPTTKENQVPVPSNSSDEKNMTTATSTATAKPSWNVIHEMLQAIPSPSTNNHGSTFRCGNEDDDPMGRLFLGALLSKNPTLTVLHEALRVFPYSIQNNPAAFFTACHSAGSDVLLAMMRHNQYTEASGDKEGECPYPWIYSSQVPFDCAKLLIEAYPEGVLYPSKQFLSGYNLLEHFLMSNEIVEKRRYDHAIWTKFKLVLLATAYCERNKETEGFSSTDFFDSPVHALLGCILSKSELFHNKGKAHHMLWLLRAIGQSDGWVFKIKSTAHHDTYPLQYVLSHNCQSVVGGGSDMVGLPIARELVKILIQSNPDAVRKNVFLKRNKCTNHERSTLQLALENGWPCHDLLLSVYPEALDIQDPKTHLYPFQMAALRIRDWHVHVVSTTQPTAFNAPDATAMDLELTPQDVKAAPFQLDIAYELLRANPSQLRAVSSISNKALVASRA